MDEILKGNFKTKNDIKPDEQKAPTDEKTKIREELKERALASLGGSMVYVERDHVNWDGDE